MDDDGTSTVQVQQNGVESDGELQSQEQPVEAKEPTLTDHLNKRLLESFLNRLEDGSFQVPASATSAVRPSPEESSEFDEG